jgi:uncharacterized protein YjlB
MAAKTYSCFGGRDSFQVVAVYPSGHRYEVRAPHDTLEGAVAHCRACEVDSDPRDTWTYQVDVYYTGSDGCRHWRGNVGGEA